MSNQAKMDKEEEAGCCSTLCRCVFGYFPWLPLMCGSATTVLIVFWKLFVDNAAKKTKSLLTEAGLQNDTANSFLVNCTLTTSVLVIVTAVVLGCILLLSIFRSHQKSLHDGLYGQGPMPGRYYWIHLCFSLILCGLLLVLVLAFISALVGVSLWLAGGAAAESAATTASRVYRHNARYAAGVDDNSALLSSNYTNVRATLTPEDQPKVDSLLNNFVSSQKIAGFPLQGTCESGCIDLKELSEMVEKPICKCSTSDLLALAKQAQLVQSDLKWALGSISLAVMFGILMLMNVSSRITDTRRDLSEGELPPLPPYGNKVAPMNEVDEEAGTKRGGHMELHAAATTAPATVTTTRAAEPPHQPEFRAAPVAAPSMPPTPAVNQPHHSFGNSMDSSLLSSLTYLRGSSPAVPSATAAASPAPATRAAPHHTPAAPSIASSLHTNSASIPPTPPATQPLMPTAAASSASVSTPVSHTVVDGNLSSSVVGSVDLKDGWRGIQSRYKDE